MKSIKLVPLFALGALLLGACELSFSIPFGNSGDTTSTTPTSYTSASIVPGQGYYRPSSYSITQTDYKNGAGLLSLNTTGVPKLLVIPVIFSDYTCPSNCSARLDDLETTFFGDSADTDWESVASFYHKSSYGQLTLEGVVTPLYQSSMTANNFAENVRTTGEYADYYDPTWLIVEEAVAWYKSYSGSNLTEYDTDNDGFIDAVWIVYNNPNSQNATYRAAGEDIFWAYTYWDYDNWSNYDVTDPVPMTYDWASYDFMYEGYGPFGIDDHTYIHEAEHIIGLDDYYSYTDGDWGAAGRIDMMDFNVVDHNSYSKFLFGWVDPFVIDGTEDEVTLSLNPFESSGEFILINDSWNGSAYDEYLAIEFYTPTGLNYKDSQAGGYPGNGVRGFSIPGVKIYHVDSRLGEFNYSGSFIDYTDEAVLTSYSYPYIAHSNSAEYSINDNYRLLHLLESDGVNTFKDNFAYADNDTLFVAVDEFTPSSFTAFFTNSGGRFNDGSSIGYSIEINSVSTSSASITINKI